MPSRYKYTAISGVNTREVSPLGKPQIQFNRETDNFRYGYSEKISTEFTFSGNDFHWFNAIEHSEARCDYVILQIDLTCKESIVIAWKRARLSMNAGKWDQDRCTVIFTADEQSRFTCYDDNSDAEINLFDFVDSDQIVHISPPGTIEYMTCIVGGDNASPPPCPDDDTWTLYRYYDASGDVNNQHVEEYYARFNVGGTFFPAIVFDPITTSPAEGITDTKYKIAGIDNSGNIDNGMLLENAIQSLIDNACPGLTIKSNFFQWNPDTVTDINYVTGEASLVNNLKLFQKSDAKRPDFADASIAMAALEKLLTNICIMFWLRWDIDEDNSLFIIEHISFFQNSPGLDFTQPRYIKNMRGLNKYSYKRNEMPKFEKFSFMEAENADFLGGDFNPISYNSSCVSQDSKNNVKEYKADIITTDLNFLLNNPAPDNEQNKDLKASDEGFCLIACNDNDMVITLPGILDQDSLNNSLSWSHLFIRYHLHGRVLNQGVMNRQATNFLSTVKIKQQDKFKVPFCCDDVFHPNDLITTAVGDDGEVSTATIDLFAETIELDISFSAD